MSIQNLKNISRKVFCEGFIPWLILFIVKNGFSCNYTNLFNTRKMSENGLKKTLKFFKNFIRKKTAIKHKMIIISTGWYKIAMQES